jgi:hypothetical protein
MYSEQNDGNSNQFQSLLIIPSNALQWMHFRCFETHHPPPHENGFGNGRHVLQVILWQSINGYSIIVDIIV